MEEQKEMENSFSAWIDRENRVVSFEKAEGFTEIRFLTHEEKFMFVIRKSEMGYRIQ